MIRMEITKQNSNYIKNGFSKMKDDKDFLALMNYAKSLFVGTLSHNVEKYKDIIDLVHYEDDMTLADAIAPFNLELLNYYAGLETKNPKRYQLFTIKKKSGEDRLINAPVGNLKIIQRCLNIIFQCLFTPHKSAMGFRMDKSIVDNAKIHTGNNYVYNIDLKDFFFSINQSRIEDCLRAKPFSLDDEKEKIIKIIAGLCCNKNLIALEDTENNKENSPINLLPTLPQGAPTSPTLSNIAAYSLDVQLCNLAKRFKLRYSRYADDITFSSMHNIYQKESAFIKELSKIIEREGFTINEAKVRLQEKSIHRQEVTGLVVNEKVNVKRRYIKQIRAWLYLWKTYDYEKAEQYFLRDYLIDKRQTKPTNPNFANVLLGKLNYLKMVVSSDDKRYKKLRDNFDELYKPLKEQKKERKKAWHQTEVNLLPHKPKDTSNFLKLFSDNNGFKFLVHDFDNSEEEFSLHTLVLNAKNEYDKVKKLFLIPKSLRKRFEVFAFDKKPSWFTWEKGKNETIQLGWSCSELRNWCNGQQNLGIHPFRNRYFLENMIMPFKHCIEVRKGKLEQIFGQVVEKRLNDKFSINYINLDRANFLTDVNVFQSGLMYLFAPFQEFAENTNSFLIEVSFTREIVNNFRMKIIKITHLGSLPKRYSNDEDLIKGDLKEAKQRFNGLCNWAIEAKFEDEDNEGFKRVHILYDNPETPKIEIIEKSTTGFTHILSFY
jgi:RNA-directed DNA polymerase